MADHVEAARWECLALDVAELETLARQLQDAFARIRDLEWGIAGEHLSDTVRARCQ